MHTPVYIARITGSKGSWSLSTKQESYLACRKTSNSPQTLWVTKFERESRFKIIDISHIVQLLFRQANWISFFLLYNVDHCFPSLPSQIVAFDSEHILHNQRPVWEIFINHWHFAYCPAIIESYHSLISLFVVQRWSLFPLVVLVGSCIR